LGFAPRLWLFRQPRSSSTFSAFSAFAAFPFSAFVAAAAAIFGFWQNSRAERQGSQASVSAARIRGKLVMTLKLWRT
jgi:hypothetical protein